MDFKGYFYMMSRQTGMVLDVRGSNPSDDAPIIIWHLKSKGVPEVQLWNQLWKYNSETGELESRLKNTPRVDVSGGNAYNGAEIVKNPANYSPSQKWYFKPDGTIESGLGDMWVLDVKGGHTDPATSVILHQRQEGGPSISQQWDVVPYVPTLLEDGFYIRNYQSNCYLQVKGDSCYLTVKDDRSVSDASIQEVSIGEMGDCKAQRWKYNTKTRAIYSVEHPDLAIDVSGGNAENSTKIIATKQESPEKANQPAAWTFERNGSIVSGLGTQWVLEASGGAGSLVILHTWQKTENQQWYIEIPGDKA